MSTPIIEAFEKFDRENPHVWDYWIQFAKQAASAGYEILSASMVAERIRWEIAIETYCEDGFKINNNHKAYYARKFNETFPDLGAAFRTRLTAAERQEEWEAQKLRGDYEHTT